MVELLKALLPSIGVGLLFWYVMRNIFRADRREREQMEKFYSEHEVSELDENADPGVMLTPVKTTDEEKGEHGTGDATRPHG